MSTALHLEINLRQQRLRTRRTKISECPKVKAAYTLSMLMKISLLVGLAAVELWQS